MIKLARAMVSVLSLGVLVSQTATATTICETEVPTAATGRQMGQTLKICASSASAAHGKVIKGSGSSTDDTGGYTLTVGLERGSVGADLYIVDGYLGNIVSGCTVEDTTANSGADPTNTTCSVTTTEWNNSPDTPKQFYMYLIHN
jgi:hypothetical protein